MSTPQSLGRTEFVALMAMLSATVAFTIDAMLPALPEIGQAFSPDAPNKAQLVITAFIFGLGAGTFIVGPLSDRFGRKPVILWGAGLYILGAVLAMMSQSLGVLLLARVCQGLGAAGPRIVGLAIIRDLYKGRDMARIMSFVMMIFTLAPAVAPLVGSLVLKVTSWHGIFATFIGFAVISGGWLQLRLREPLPPEKRLPLQPAKLWGEVRWILSIRLVRLVILVQTLCYAALFASISSIQQIIGESFGKAEQFPYWFGAIAIFSGTGSILNASLVMRLGMRRMVSMTLNVLLVLSLLALLLLRLDLPTPLRFAVYLVWQMSIFYQATLTLGNLTSLAMEPLGKVAGMGASVIAGLSTVGSVLITIPIGLSYDGTPLPLITGALACALLARLLMTRLQDHPDPPPA